MKDANEIARVVFSAAAALISAAVGNGYHWVQYHNMVEHYKVDLPQMTTWVVAVAPWVFLLPLVVLCGGLIWRRRPLLVLSFVNIGWVFAVAWPALCLWAWAEPTVVP